MLVAMRETARLVGFFAAHGIWSIGDGETLVPILGYEQPGGIRGMDRLITGDRPAAPGPARTRWRPAGAAVSGRCSSSAPISNSAPAGPTR
jgi:hypothetical protein